MRPFKIPAICLIAALGVALGAATASPARASDTSITPVPLTDPGFETGTWSSWVLPSWGGNNAAIDSTVARTGNYSARLYVRPWAGAFEQFFPVNVHPGVTAGLSLWAKMPYPGTQSTKWFTVILYAFDGDGNQLDYAYHGQFDAMPNWTQITLRLDLPAGTEQLKVWMSTQNGHGQSTGIVQPVWIDDIALWLEGLNRVPVADAGSALTAECSGTCGTSVTLDGSDSYDPDGDAITYEWVAAGITFDDATSATPTGTFPLGSTLVTLTVTDSHGSSAVADVLVTVEDSTAPVVVCTTDRIALWPPNHDFVPVFVVVEATDSCTDAGALLVDCTVSSSEPDDATGDGSHTGDVDGEDGYTAPVAVTLTWSESASAWIGVVDLRAERDGSKLGRAYSIHCVVEDAAGNEATASCAVVVPHNSGKGVK